MKLRTLACCWMSSLVLASATPMLALAEEQASTTRSELTDLVSKYFGVTYFTFFDGPGVGEPVGLPPGGNGRPTDTGLGFWTNLSVRFKFSQRYALDYQFRLQQIVTNDFELRDQGGRVGVSGELMRGDDWVLTGAVNSDLPGIGQIPSQRTLIANPGLFSQLSYKPSGSRWSLYSMVSPRVFFYRDRLALSDQDEAQGLSPGAKPQLVLQLNPSLNYAFSDTHGARLGMTFDIRKNSVGPAQRWFWPVDMGYTLSLNKRINLYPHLRFSTPLDNGLRQELAQAKNRTPSPWTHTASVGLWINGTLL